MKQENVKPSWSDLLKITFNLNQVTKAFCLSHIKNINVMRISIQEN